MGQNLLGSDDDVDDTPTQGGYDDVGAVLIRWDVLLPIPYFFAMCNVYICTYLYIFLMESQSKNMFFTLYFRNV